MNVLINLGLFGGFSVILIIIFIILIKRLNKPLEPTLMNFVNLLHKYQNPDHPKIIPNTTPDTDFRRRANVLLWVWSLKKDL